MKRCALSSALHRGWSSSGVLPGGGLRNLGSLDGYQVSLRGLESPETDRLSGDQDASFCHGHHCLCLWEQAEWEQEGFLASLGEKHLHPLHT